MIADLPPARYRQLVDVLDEVLELGPQDRAPMLERIVDSDLRARVEASLAISDRLGGFLETSAGALLPGAVEDLALGTEPSLVPEGTRIGPYVTFREVLGEGDGRLYLARPADGPEARAVELHVLGRGSLPPLAAIDHPGIPRILDQGPTTDGRYWVARERVEGTPITTHCRERSLAVEARLALFLRASEVVACAHGHGMHHGDLKPENILVGPDGETRIAGFDLWPGSHEASADVRGLGLVLLELLVGRRPWRVKGRGLSEIERAALDVEGNWPPALATRLGDDRARRLREIVARALRPDAACPGVEALCADVDQLVRDLPTSTRLAALRQPALVALVAALLILLAWAAYARLVS